jgi:hypothetical protein
MLGDDLDEFGLLVEWLRNCTGNTRDIILRPWRCTQILETLYSWYTSDGPRCENGNWVEDLSLDQALFVEIGVMVDFKERKGRVSLDWGDAVSLVV